MTVPHQHIGEQLCLECQKPLNAVGTLEGEVPMPKKGDLTLCMHCGAVMQFDKKGLLIPVDEQRLSKNHREEVAKVRQRIRASKAVLN